jgi:hypothetical protein
MHKIHRYKGLCERKNRILNYERKKAVEIMYDKKMKPKSSRTKCPFILQWVYSPLLRPGHFFRVVIFFKQTIGLLGRVISPSQGRYLHTG